MSKITAAINDLSGLGQSSLCAVIPILSVMGVQVCPLPTAVLSSQTDGYNGYSFLDMTDSWPQYMAHWRQEAPLFDCIYSGFLGSDRQIAMLRQFIKDFAQKDTLIVIDPVLGDNGQLYDTMDDNMVCQMRRLITSADVITPNYTELCFLSASSYREEIEWDWIKEQMQQLSASGPNKVVVTGIPTKAENLTVTAVYEQKPDRFTSISTKLLTAHYPGSGDIFAAVLVGCLLNGLDIISGVQKAADFVYHAIELSLKQNRPFREGVVLEQALPFLYMKDSERIDRK